MTQRNTGKASEELFEDYFKAQGKIAFCYRIEDASDLHGRNKKLVMTTKKPSDWVVTENGSMYYAEVKSTTNKTSFPFTMISKNQWATARRQIAAGGSYFFFIHDLTKDNWYKVPAEILLNVTDRKSITWADLAPFLWGIYDTIHRRDGGH